MMVRMTPATYVHAYEVSGVKNAKHFEGVADPFGGCRNREALLHELCTEGAFNCAASSCIAPTGFEPMF